MNRPPEILVNSGFVTDQNGVWTEMVIPSVVATLDPPKKIVFNGTALNYMPSTAAALKEFEAPNLESIVWGTSYSGNYYPTFTMGGYTKVETVKLNGIVSMVSVSNFSNGAFQGCSLLSTFQANNLQTILDTSNGNSYGAFYNCTSLVNINLRRLTSISTTNANGGGTFGNCTGLQSVTLGSEGYPVTALWAKTFNGCIQTGLTITIYTQGGAALSGEPWGATNATIEYEEA